MRSSCKKRDGELHSMKQNDKMIRNVRGWTTMTRTYGNPLTLVRIEPMWRTEHREDRGEILCQVVMVALGVAFPRDSKWRENKV